MSMSLSSTRRTRHYLGIHSTHARGVPAELQSLETDAVLVRPSASSTQQTEKLQGRTRHPSQTARRTTPVDSTAGDVDARAIGFMPTKIEGRSASWLCFVSPVGRESKHRGMFPQWKHIWNTGAHGSTYDSTPLYEEEWRLVISPQTIEHGYFI
jgi:hypothetical protein